MQTFDLSTANGFTEALRARDTVAVMAEALFESKFPNTTNKLSAENRTVRTHFVDQSRLVIERLNKYSAALKVAKR